MVTTSTYLGGSFPRQWVRQPACPRRDDWAGGDSAVTGTVSVPCGCSCPASVWSCVAPQMCWAWRSCAGRWWQLAPVTLPVCSSSCSASALAAGKSLSLKAFANSLSKNDSGQVVVPCSSRVPACQHTQLSSPFLQLFLWALGDAVAGQSRPLLLKPFSQEPLADGGGSQEGYT